jgi:hypothetical protein
VVEILVGFHVPDPDKIEEDLQEILKELGYVSEGETLVPRIHFPAEVLEIMIVVVGLVILLYVGFHFVNQSIAPLRVEPPVLRRKREEAELVEKKDYAKLYRRAVTLGRKAQYGEAVRMLYLAALILLDAKNIIGYHPSLTNIEYKQSVTQYPFAVGFNAMTHTFDTIFYGGKKATGEDFSACITAFCSIEEAVS